VSRTGGGDQWASTSNDRWLAETLVVIGDAPTFYGAAAVV
jgi:hypothetical protein